MGQHRISRIDCWLPAVDATRVFQELSFTSYSEMLMIEEIVFLKLVTLNSYWMEVRGLSRDCVFALMITAH